ncbi:hypothetical protein ACP4OV_006971 [Aristida adscensionis]
MEEPQVSGTGDCNLRRFGLSAAGQDRDYNFMKKAIDEAYRAVDSGGYPFGAVIVRGDEAVVSCHNMVRTNRDPSAHAEITAIRECLQKTRKNQPLRLRNLLFLPAMPNVHRRNSFLQDQERGVWSQGGGCRCCWMGGFIPEAFVEYYQKSGMEIRQAEGDAARIAEEVFEKIKRKSG